MADNMTDLDKLIALVSDHHKDQARDLIDSIVKDGLRQQGELTARLLSECCDAVQEDWPKSYAR